MSELEERLNSVLNDPEQLGKLTQMAKSLMGGDSMPAMLQQEAVAAQSGFPDLGIDLDMLTKVSSMMMSGDGKSSRHRVLLEAMAPYLAEKRRRRMEQALKMAKMAKLAKIAFAEFGGDGGE